MFHCCISVFQCLFPKCLLMHPFSRFYLHIFSSKSVLILCIDISQIFTYSLILKLFTYVHKFSALSARSIWLSAIDIEMYFLLSVLLVLFFSISLKFYLHIQVWLNKMRGLFLLHYFATVYPYMQNVLWYFSFALYFCCHIGIGWKEFDRFV
jgi:hypothetical protein